MSIQFENYSKKLEPREIRGIKQNWYRWRVFVNEPDEILDKIEYVDYLLHPSFPGPNRRVGQERRNSRFYLESEGYAGFYIDITVKFKDGTEEETGYTLDIQKPWLE